MDPSVDCTALHTVKTVESLSSDALQGAIGRLLGRCTAMKTIPGIKAWRRVENAVVPAVRLANCGDCQIRSGGGADGRTGIVTRT